MTAAHKTQTKIQTWSSLVFHCCHSSFNPSEAPPWDSRPVSGAGVVHYHLLHRPRSVPTALGPAPLVTLTNTNLTSRAFVITCVMSDVWHLHYRLWQYTIHDAVITANVTALVVTCFIHSIWHLALCCWCEAACSCSALETHYIKLLLQSVLLILMPVLVCNSSAIESAVLMTLRIICLRTQWLCSVTLRGLLLGCCCS